MTLMRKLCPGMRGTFPGGDGAVSVDVDVGSGGAVASGVGGSIPVGVGLSVGGAVAVVGCPVPAGFASRVAGTAASGVAVGAGARVVRVPQAVRMRNNVNAAAPTGSQCAFLRPTRIASELHGCLVDWKPHHIYRRWEAQKSSLG